MEFRGQSLSHGHLCCLHIEIDRSNSLQDLYVNWTDQIVGLIDIPSLSLDNVC